MEGRTADRPPKGTSTVARSRKRLALLAGLAVVLLLAGTGGYFAFRNRPGAAPPPKQEAARPSEVILEGKLQGRTVVEIAAPISGRVESVNVAVGDEVYEGQLLTQIKSEALEGQQEAAALDYEKAQTRVNDLEAAISAARLESSRAEADSSRIRGDFERATRMLERQRLLLAQGATPRQAFEKAEREFKVLEEEIQTVTAVAKQAEERIVSLTRELDTARKLLQAQADNLEGAKERLEAGQVVSPTGGVVVSSKAKAGEQTESNVKDLFIIATDLSVMEAVAEVTPAQQALIKTGQAAFVVTAESPDEPFQGTVTKIEGGNVTVEFGNPNPNVRPGLTAQVRVKIP